MWPKASTQQFDTPGVYILVLTGRNVDIIGRIVEYSLYRLTPETLNSLKDIFRELTFKILKKKDHIRSKNNCDPTHFTTLSVH